MVIYVYLLLFGLTVFLRTQRVAAYAQTRKQQIHFILLYWLKQIAVAALLL